MMGRPVWLASVSRINSRRELIATEDWGIGLRNRADRICKEILQGVGDRAYERVFRMNVTFCYHRGLSDEEIAGLPEWWHEAPPVDIAGGPIEVLRSSGCAARPSVLPCENPGREYLPGEPRTSKLWIPQDCGDCPPCLDREEVRVACS